MALVQAESSMAYGMRNFPMTMRASIARPYFFLRFCILIRDASEDIIVGDDLVYSGVSGGCRLFWRGRIPRVSCAQLAVITQRALATPAMFAWWVSVPLFHIFTFSDRLNITGRSDFHAVSVDTVAAVLCVSLHVSRRFIPGQTRPPSANI